MPLHVVEHRIIYRTPRYYCGPGPSVVTDEQDTLTVAFRRVPSWLDYGHSSHWHPATELCLTDSEDNGRTWSSPRVFLGGYQCPNLTRLRDGALIHSTHRFELVPPEIAEELPDGPGVRKGPSGDVGRTGVRMGVWPGVQVGTAIWRSENEGRTWGDPVYLDDVPGLAPLCPNLHAPVAVRGNVLETSGGQLLMSAYDLGPESTAYLFRSDDGGRSWAYHAPIAEGFNEAFLYETARGDLIAFLRRGGEDLSVLHMARSGDGGTTWVPPEPLWRGYPACALRMPSGRVLVVYGYRFPDGYGVRARLLSSDCEPLDLGECILRDDGAMSDLGYPDAALMDDGRAFVVYYMNVRSDAVEGTAPPRFIVASVVEEQAE